MEKQLHQKLKEVKNKIVANSKDAHFAESLISELVGLQKQTDIEPTEVIIPLADIEKSYDFETTKLSKTRTGKFVFEAKGGMYTIVEMRMRSLYELCEHIFEYLENPSDDKELDDMEGALRDATLYSLQTPILCSLDQRMLYEVTTKMIESFSEYATGIASQDLKPETEEDIKANNEFIDSAKAVGEIVNTPIPDIDNS